MVFLTLACAASAATIGYASFPAFAPTPPPIEEPLEDPIVEPVEDPIREPVEDPVEEPTVDEVAPARTVRLESTPTGAEVLDARGVLIGNTPMTIERPREGRVSYRIQRRGYHPREIAVDPTGAETMRLSLRRVRRAPEASTATTTTVTSTDTTGSPPGFGAIEPELMDFDE